MFLLIVPFFPPLKLNKLISEEEIIGATNSYFVFYTLIHNPQQTKIPTLTGVPLNNRYSFRSLSSTVIPLLVLDNTKKGNLFEIR